MDRREFIATLSAVSVSAILPANATDPLLGTIPDPTIVDPPIHAVDSELFTLDVDAAISQEYVVEVEMAPSSYLGGPIGTAGRTHHISLTYLQDILDSKFFDHLACSHKVRVVSTQWGIDLEGYLVEYSLTHQEVSFEIVITPNVTLD